MFYEFKGHRPMVDASAFVHPQAAVTGNVVIGKDVYIGPGAAIRGDWGKIIIEDGCNVQENCTIHMFPGVTVLVEGRGAYWSWCDRTWGDDRPQLSGGNEQCHHGWSRSRG